MLKDWKPVKPTVIESERDTWAGSIKITTTNYRRFLNADDSMVGAIGFKAFDSGDGVIDLTLQISDCRRSITLEFVVDDEDVNTVERARYKLDSIQEALNYAYETLGV